MATMMNAEEFNELILQRRSVFPKDYTGEKVSDDIVKQILENARWAPSHKLTQPWRFVVFTEGGIRALAKFQSDLYSKVTQRDGTFKEATYLKLLTKPLLSSHIIAILMMRHEKKAVPEVEEIGAVFCAVQNMYLTASAYGIGAYLSTGGITYFEQAKEFFGLQEEDRLIGFFHLGIPAKTYPSSMRKSLQEVTHWVVSE